MTFTLKTYIGQRGERFSLLFSSEDPGVPLFYPCAFISRRVRDTSTHQTQTTTLKGIQRLIEWERDRKVSLEGKLSRGETMAPFEIDDLAGHVHGCRDAKKGDVISSQKFNGYWSSICKYIDCNAESRPRQQHHGRLFEQHRDQRALRRNWTWPPPRRLSMRASPLLAAQA
jgi:hypothetical protein